MSTFQEMQENLTSAKFRKTIFTYLVEHLDSNFQPVGTSSPKNCLLTDDKIKVPPEAIEEVTAEFLQEIEDLDKAISAILKTTIPEKK